MEHIDIVETLIRRAGVYLAEAYTVFQEIKISSKQKEEGAEYYRLRKKEIELCVESVVLFQVAMEAIINEEIHDKVELEKIRKEEASLQKKYRTLSFKNKWEKSFLLLNIRDRNHSLKNYFEFYNKFRVTVIHPKSRYINMEEFRFSNVYQGIKFGFVVIELLYKKIEKKNMISWKEYCRLCSLPFSPSM